jgi:hypothetical protein
VIAPEATEVKAPGCCAGEGVELSAVVVNGMARSI